MAGHWTQERDEELLSLKRQGYSAAQIASMLGDDLSRNAILGRLHRLGIRDGKVVTKRTKPRKNTPLSVKRVAAPKPSKRTAPVVEFVRPKRELGEILLPPRKPKTRIVCTEADRSLASTPLGLSVMDLGPEHCRWPVNDPEPKQGYLFCGHPKRFGSYCAAHAAMSVGEGTRAEAMATRVDIAA